LRFYDPEGNLVPLPEEAAQQQAEAAQQQAEMAEQRGALRQLLRLLSVRFGDIPQEIEPRLRSHRDPRSGARSVEQLEALVDIAIAAGSWEEFIAQLD
jgi:hypothetical protein